MRQYTLLNEEKINPQMYGLVRINNDVPPEEVLAEISMWASGKHSQTSSFQRSKRAYYKRYMDMKDTHTLKIYRRNHFLDQKAFMIDFVPKQTEKSTSHGSEPAWFSLRLRKPVQKRMSFVITEKDLLKTYQMLDDLAISLDESVEIYQSIRPYPPALNYALENSERRSSRTESWFWLLLLLAVVVLQSLIRFDK